MITAEIFDGSPGDYRGAQILPCDEIPAGLCSSLGLINDDVTNLVRWAYQAGRDQAAADVAEMNEQLTKNTLGALSRIATLETDLRAMQRRNHCPVCHGSGAYMLNVGGMKPLKCQRCNGTGRSAS